MMTKIEITFCNRSYIGYKSNSSSIDDGYYSSWGRNNECYLYNKFVDNPDYKGNLIKIEFDRYHFYMPGDGIGVPSDLNLKINYLNNEFIIFEEIFRICRL